MPCELSLAKTRPSLLPASAGVSVALPTSSRAVGSAVGVSPTSTTAANVGCSLSAAVGTSVAVGARVAPGARVAVGATTAVDPSVAVGAFVAVFACVACAVAVAVLVCVASEVAVRVGIGVAVGIGVGVGGILEGSSVGISVISIGGITGMLVAVTTGALLTIAISASTPLTWIASPYLVESSTLLTSKVVCPVFNPVR